MTEKIKLQCPYCGYRITVNKYEPYLGHAHSSGWNYKCEHCSASLQEKGEDNETT